MARSDPNSQTIDFRQWLAAPSLLPLDLDGPTSKAMVDCLLWELSQIGGPEHNVERCAALLKSLATLLAALTIAEDEDIVERACSWFSVELYNQMMTFRDTVARDGEVKGAHHG